MCVLFYKAGLAEQGGMKLDSILDSIGQHSQGDFKLVNTVSLSADIVTNLQRCSLLN